LVILIKFLEINQYFFIKLKVAHKDSLFCWCN